MPLDLIVISLMRTSKWINVLMVSSPDDDSTNPKQIDVTANGIRWIERDFEQFTPLGNFFKMNTNPEVGLNVDLDTDTETTMKISLLNINDEALEKQTVNVAIQGVKLNLNESMTCGLKCSNCYNDLVHTHRFSCIKRMSIYTQKPRKYFCSKTTLSEGELYYALNYIIISQKILGKQVIRNREHLHCRRCLQLVGESLEDQTAVQLYVDTLWVSSRKQDEVGMTEGQLELLFDHLTVTQLMLHLLHDAVPISEDKTRLFLKTVRSDGQLHYMLLLVDTTQLHLLSSQPSLSEHFKINCNLNDDNKYDEEEQKSKHHRLVEVKPVHEIEVRGFRGCRISYHIFSSDEQLAENDDLIDQWRNEGTPMLRISYAMMMDLHRELKINEALVSKMEGTPTDIDEKEGRTSYIIYKPDEKNKQSA